MKADRYPPLVREALTHIPVNVPRSLVAPPIHRMSWAAGVALPPPLMAGPLRNFIYFSIVFGAPWGLFMMASFLLMGANAERVEQVMIPTAAVAGVAFGLMMALVFSYNARRYGVPSWDDVVRGMPEKPPAN